MSDRQNRRPASAQAVSPPRCTRALLAAHGAGAAEPITLTETGSTLIYPLFNIWASEYPKTHPT